MPEIKVTVTPEMAEAIDRIRVSLGQSRRAFVVHAIASRVKNWRSPIAARAAVEEKESEIVPAAAEVGIEYCIGPSGVKWRKEEFDECGKEPCVKCLKG